MPGGIRCAPGSSELWIAGFPSRYGGADTELDHFLDLACAHGVQVHLVPMFGVDPEMKASVLRRGCSVHRYRPDIFAGRTVASFCNGQFLEHLGDIVSAGRPKQVIWFNCMTWLFENERKAHRSGWIDYFGFTSRYQLSVLAPQLRAVGPFKSFDYRPFFNPSRVEWRYREWDGQYRVGRISRDDAGKFAADTWNIFDRVLVPDELSKKVYVLGFGPNAEQKTGSAPPTLDWRTWSPGEISAEQFYRTIDTMVHKTGGSRESYCRVLVEAYAHGVVPIVERDYAFPELVIDGETGFMASSSDEMSYRASWLAHNPAEHRRLAENGRAHLERLMDSELCWRPWKPLLGLTSGEPRQRPESPGSRRSHAATATP